MFPKMPLKNKENHQTSSKYKENYSYPPGAVPLCLFPQPRGTQGILGEPKGSWGTPYDPGSPWVPVKSPGPFGSAGVSWSVQRFPKRAKRERSGNAINGFEDHQLICVFFLGSVFFTWSQQKVIFSYLPLGRAQPKAL